MNTFAELIMLRKLSMTVNALAVAGDVLIAAVLCMMFHSSRTGSKRSDTILNILILFSVNTGLLTSLCAIGSLVAIILSPNTFIYICFYFLLGRLYCNSLLATLNARKAIRAQDDNSAFSLSLQMINGSKSTIQSRPKFFTKDITVETAQEFVIEKQVSSQPVTTTEVAEVRCEVV